MKTLDAVVVGGGLAGASVAHALRKRGAQVALFEALPALAGKASGNMLGLLVPYFGLRASPLSSFYGEAFRWSRSFLDSIGAFHFPTGALQLPSTPRLTRVMEDLAASKPDTLEFRKVSAEESSAIAGITLDTECLFAPRATALNPPKLVHALAAGQESKMTIIAGSPVGSLERKGGAWQIMLRGDATPAATAPVVVVCGAYESSTLNPTAWMPLEAVRGQSTVLHSTIQSLPLQTLLCFDGYLTPAHDGYHMLGAHYRHNDMRDAPSLEDTLSIRERAHRRLPSLSLTSSEINAERVCFRTSTIDRLPYVGAVPDFPAMLEETRGFRPGSDLERLVPYRPFEGLYISAGHGSRGLLSCPISGEVIARAVAGEASAELASFASLADPRRIVERLLKRLREATRVRR